MTLPFGPFSPAWRAALERMRTHGQLAPRRDRDREARERWDAEGGSLAPVRAQK
jgi:hypothetical protein